MGDAAGGCGADGGMLTASPPSPHGSPQAGSIVPAEVTVRLLDEAMKKSEATCFLVDGFPRNADNLDCWVKLMTHCKVRGFGVRLRATVAACPLRACARSLSLSLSHLHVVYGACTTRLTRPRALVRSGVPSQVEFVLMLECPEEVMEQRLLKRGETSGRR